MPPPVRKPKFSYTQEQLLRALHTVCAGDSVNSASKRFGIPQSTLALKASGKTPVERKMGPQPVLEADVKKMIVNWLKGLDDKGFPVTKIDILVSVNKLITDMKLNNNVTNGKLGEKWFTLFMKRHSDLVHRKPEKLSKIRADLTEQNVRAWFEDVKSYLKSINAEDVLEAPERILNLDETSFWLCPKTGKVICAKGKKIVYEVHGGNEKESITVLCNKCEW